MYLQVRGRRWLFRKRGGLDFCFPLLRTTTRPIETINSRVQVPNPYDYSENRSTSEPRERACGTASVCEPEDVRLTVRVSVSEHVLGQREEKGDSGL